MSMMHVSGAASWTELQMSLMYRGECFEIVMRACCVEKTLRRQDTHHTTGEVRDRDVQSATKSRDGKALYQ